MALVQDYPPGQRTSERVLKVSTADAVFRFRLTLPAGDHSAAEMLAAIQPPVLDGLRELGDLELWYHVGMAGWRELTERTVGEFCALSPEGLLRLFARAAPSPQVHRPLPRQEESVAANVPASTLGQDILDAVVRKCGQDAHVLILSCGNRPGGARGARRVEQWVQSKGYEYELAVYNPFDVEARAVSSSFEQRPLQLAVQEFFLRTGEPRKERIIFHIGHGDRWGRWRPWLLGPEDVKRMAGSNQPTIITGCCFGGHWLAHFDGLTGCRPEHKNRGGTAGAYGPLWQWLFDGAPFPPQAPGHSPMMRGLLPLQHDAPEPSVATARPPVAA